MIVMIGASIAHKRAATKLLTSSADSIAQPALACVGNRAGLLLSGLPPAEGQQSHCEDVTNGLSEIHAEGGSPLRPVCHHPPTRVGDARPAVQRLHGWLQRSRLDALLISVQLRDGPALQHVIQLAEVLHLLRANAGTWSQGSCLRMKPQVALRRAKSRLG